MGRKGQDLLESAGEVAGSRRESEKSLDGVRRTSQWWHKPAWAGVPRAVCSAAWVLLLPLLPPVLT